LQARLRLTITCIQSQQVKLESSKIRGALAPCRLYFGFLDDTDVTAIQSEISDQVASGYSLRAQFTFKAIRLPASCWASQKAYRVT
jgi:hypothetical protein